MGVTRSLDAGRARGTAGLLFGRSASRPVLLLAPRVLAAMFVLLCGLARIVCVCVFEEQAFRPFSGFLYFSSFVRPTSRPVIGRLTRDSCVENPSLHRGQLFPNNQHHNHSKLRMSSSGNLTLATLPCLSRTTIHTAMASYSSRHVLMMSWRPSCRQHSTCVHTPVSNSAHHGRGQPLVALCAGKLGATAATQQHSPR